MPLDGTGVEEMFTVFVHSHLETFLEATGLALVAVGLVDDAVPAARLTPEFNSN